MIDDYNRVSLNCVISLIYSVFPHKHRETNIYKINNTFIIFYRVDAMSNREYDSHVPTIFIFINII